MRALSALGCLGLAAGFLVGGPAHRTSSLLQPTHARPHLMMASFTQNAPPAPPPVVSSGGGGGGGDDGRNEYLRLLDVDEQSELLADWIARARIYKVREREREPQHSTHTHRNTRSTPRVRLQPSQMPSIVPLRLSSYPRLSPTLARPLRLS